MRTKNLTVEYANNGYVVRIGDESFVYEDEVEVLNCIRMYLELDKSETIEIKRKEK